jgi:hypothetical protein
LRVPDLVVSKDRPSLHGGFIVAEAYVGWPSNLQVFDIRCSVFGRQICTQGL